MSLSKMPLSNEEVQKILDRVPGIDFQDTNEYIEFILKEGTGERTPRTDELTIHLLVNRRYFPSLQKEDPKTEVPTHEIIDAVIRELYVAFHEYSPNEIKVALATYIKNIERPEIKEGRFDPKKIELI